jgi:hypothetical protein
VAKHTCQHASKPELGPQDTRGGGRELSVAIVPYELFSDVHTHIMAKTHASVSQSINPCMPECLRLTSGFHTNAQVYTCTCIHTNMCRYLHRCALSNMDTHGHTHTHTHTHTSTHSCCTHKDQIPEKSSLHPWSTSDCFLARILTRFRELASASV